MADINFFIRKPPLLLVYDGVHYETLLPATHEDSLLTMELVNNWRQGDFNISHRDIDDARVAAESNKEREERSDVVREKADKRARSQEDERGSRKSKKRKVFEQITKSDCEEQLENVWKKVPKRGQGNKIMKEKEANANNLNVQNQRRKIFEQLEEMEEAQRRREAISDEESEEGKNTRKGENTLQNKTKQNKRKNIQITKTAAIERIGKMEAIIDEMENEVLKIESMELRSKEFHSRKMRSEIEKLQVGLEMLVLSKSEELKRKADLEGIFNTMSEIIKLNLNEVNQARKEGAETNCEDVFELFENQATCHAGKCKILPFQEL